MGHVAIEITNSRRSDIEAIANPPVLTLISITKEFLSIQTVDGLDMLPLIGHIV